MEGTADFPTKLSPQSALTCTVDLRAQFRVLE